MENSNLKDKFFEFSRWAIFTKADPDMIMHMKSATTAV